VLITVDAAVRARTPTAAELVDAVAAQRRCTARSGDDAGVSAQVAVARVERDPLFVDVAVAAAGIEGMQAVVRGVPAGEYGKEQNDSLALHVR